MRPGALLLLLALPAAAQTVRIADAPFPSPGDSYRLVRTGEEATVHRAAGLERLHQEPTNHRRVRLEGTVQVGKDSSRLAIERATLERGTRRARLDLAGREASGQGWLFDAPEELDAESASVLEQTLHSMGSLGVLRAACLPPEPVAPGDFWIARVEPFAAALGFGPDHVDLAASSATCHLERVFDRWGRVYAVVAFDADLTPRIVDGERPWRAHLRYQGRLEIAADGTVPWGRAEHTYDFSTESRFRADGRPVSIHRRSTGRGTEEILPIAEPTAVPAPRSERPTRPAPATGVEPEASGSR